MADNEAMRRSCFEAAQKRYMSLNEMSQTTSGELLFLGTWPGRRWLGGGALPPACSSNYSLSFPQLHTCSAPAVLSPLLCASRRLQRCIRASSDAAGADGRGSPVCEHSARWRTPSWRSPLAQGGTQGWVLETPWVWEGQGRCMMTLSPLPLCLLVRTLAPLRLGTFLAHIA